MSECTTNRDKYLEQFAILSGAAVGVVLTRTREPFRAVDALREFAFAKSRPFKFWTMLAGWASYDTHDPNADPTVDDIADPLQALKNINGIGGGTPMPDNVVCAMMWPHWHLPQIPHMMQCIAEYAREFAEVRRRLILMVPPEFVIPKELEDSVAVLDFDLPNQDELRAIYTRVVQAIPDKSKTPRYRDEEVDRILSAGSGCSALEFENAVSRAIVTYRDQLPNVPLATFNKLILDVKTEVVKRSEVLELMPSASMSDIGGLDELKSYVRDLRPAMSKEAEAFGVKRPKGLACGGPPGTGKSLLAKAVASELGVPLIKFDVSRVFNSLVGSSEARVRSSLKMLDAMAPCVALIDEVDKAFNMNTAGGDSGVGTRVLGAILTHMQETKSPIFWVLTFNRADGLPPELLRKGRLDEVWSVTTPDEAERTAILGIHLRFRKQDPDAIDDLAVAVEKCSGYVGAEIEAAVNEAVKHAFISKSAVTGALIADQLGKMRPLSEAFKEQFQSMEEWASNNARAASSGAATRVRTRARTRTAPPGGRGGRTMDMGGEGDGLDG